MKVLVNAHIKLAGFSTSNKIKNHCIKVSVHLLVCTAWQLHTVYRKLLWFCHLVLGYAASTCKAY